VKVDITQKAGPDGRLFGSVTNSDIADALKTATGIDVKKADVRMPQGSLKHVGEFPIVVQLHTDVLAHITVHVVGEQ
jgi:large subunit ribosomal protein L9